MKTSGLQGSLNVSSGQWATHGPSGEMPQDKGVWSLPLVGPGNLRSFQRKNGCPQSGPCFHDCQLIPVPPYTGSLLSFILSSSWTSFSSVRLRFLSPMVFFYRKLLQPLASWPSLGGRPQEATAQVWSVQSQHWKSQELAGLVQAQHITIYY